MTRLFADTYYFLALVNAKDKAHSKAAEFSESHAASLVTTSWALTELADGLSRISSKHVFLRIYQNLARGDGTIIVPASQNLFEQGVERYRSRLDKDWSLTDCSSFVVMEQYGLAEALTADHHFEQAGVRALLS